MTVPAESGEQPVADPGPASFATAEEMLRKRKREVEVNDTNDDENEGDDDDDTEDEKDGGECQDCGFLILPSSPEDHEFCVRREWACILCEYEAHSSLEATEHMIEHRENDLCEPHAGICVLCSPTVSCLVCGGRYSESDSDRENPHQAVDEHRGLAPLVVTRWRACRKR